MIGRFRTPIFALVLTATVGASTAAWARLDDAQGSESPRGGCFDTIVGACTGDPCSKDEPCPAFNTFCTTKCAPPPTPCDKDVECDDGHECTADVCVDGVCEHVCVCWGCVDR